MKATRLVLAVVTLLAGSTNAGVQKQIEACRQQIDWLDQRIVELGCLRNSAEVQKDQTIKNDLGRYLTNANAD